MEKTKSLRIESEHVERMNNGHEFKVTVYSVGPKKTSIANELTDAPLSRAACPCCGHNPNCFKCFGMGYYEVMHLNASNLQGKIMRDVAREAYDKIEVGGIGWMRPDHSKGETLEVFQSVVLAANIMQGDGLILVRSLHKEGVSGRNLVDAIQFIKIR